MIKYIREWKTIPEKDKLLNRNMYLNKLKEWSIIFVILLTYIIMLTKYLY